MEHLGSDAQGWVSFPICRSAEQKLDYREFIVERYVTTRKKFSLLGDGRYFGRWLPSLRGPYRLGTLDAKNRRVGVKSEDIQISRADTAWTY